MRTRFLPLIFAATVSVAAATLTGCAPAAEQDENTITVYAGRNEDLVAPLFEMFTKDTGIQVKTRYATSPELNALLLEEGDRSPADVFLSQDAGALGSVSNAGLVTELPSELTDLIPAGFTSENGEWIGVTGRARVIVYDSEKFTADEVPASIDELTTDEWSGRVGFAPGNASFQSFVTALRVLEGEDAADSWVKSMSENEIVVTDNNIATLDLVNSGELDLGLINHYYWFEKAEKEGLDSMRAQIKFLPGDPGGIVNVSGAAILNKAAKNENAQAFVEYLVSEKAQKYFAESLFEYPLIEGVEAPEGLPSLDSLANPEFDLSDLESLAKTQDLLAKYGLL